MHPNASMLDIASSASEILPPPPLPTHKHPAEQKCTTNGKWICMAEGCELIQQSDNCSLFLCKKHCIERGLDSEQDDLCPYHGPWFIQLLLCKKRQDAVSTPVALHTQTARGNDADQLVTSVTKPSHGPNRAKAPTQTTTATLQPRDPYACPFALPLDGNGQNFYEAVPTTEKQRRELNAQSHMRARVEEEERDNYLFIHLWAWPVSLPLLLIK